MSIVNISIEQNYNQIFVKKKDLPSFEKELNDFQKKWKDTIVLFEGKFIYVKETSKQNTYFFFQDEGEQIEISSTDYINKPNLPISFPTIRVVFLAKAKILKENKPAFYTRDSSRLNCPLFYLTVMI